MLTERQKPEQATALGSGMCSTPDIRHRCFPLDEALHLSVPSAPLGFLCSDCKAASAGADSYPVSALSPEPCHHNCAWKIHVLLWINNRSCARGTEISQFDTTVLPWGMKTPRPQVIPPWWKKNQDLNLFMLPGGSLCLFSAYSGMQCTSASKNYSCSWVWVDTKSIYNISLQAVL